MGEEKAEDLAAAAARHVVVKSSEPISTRHLLITRQGGRGSQFTVQKKHWRSQYRTIYGR